MLLLTVRTHLKLCHVEAEGEYSAQERQEGFLHIEAVHPELPTNVTRRTGDVERGRRMHELGLQESNPANAVSFLTLAIQNDPGRRKYYVARGLRS